MHEGSRAFVEGHAQERVGAQHGGALLLSVAQFYSPDGTAIPGEGVKPDEELELDPDEGKMEPRAGITAEQLAADRYVQRALELLQTENEEQGDLAEKAAA